MTAGRHFATGPHRAFLILHQLIVSRLGASVFATYLQAKLQLFLFYPLDSGSGREWEKGVSCMSCITYLYPSHRLVYR